MNTALVAGEQVLVMLMLMAVGFTLYRMKLLSDESCSQLNKILLTVVTFAVLFSSYNREFDPQMLRNIGIGMLFSAAAHATGTALAYLFIRGKSETDRSERLACILSNCGFMGIPLVSSLVGSDGVVYASCGVLVLNIFQWTFGRIILTGRFDRKGILRQLINPGTLGCVAGLTLFCLPVTLPRPLASAFDYIASLNTPLAMVVIGTLVARTKVAESLRMPRTYLVCFIKLILVPLSVLPLFRLLGASETVALSSYVVMACPCAATSSLLPALFGMRQAEKRGASLVTVATVLSVATIPLMVLVRELIG